MGSISDYKVREGDKKRNFRDSSNCDLNAMYSKCFPVRKTYKHMFNLYSVVKLISTKSEPLLLKIQNIFYFKIAGNVQ